MELDHIPVHFAPPNLLKEVCILFILLKILMNILYVEFELYNLIPLNKNVCFNHVVNRMTIHVVICFCTCSSNKIILWIVNFILIILPTLKVSPA